MNGRLAEARRSGRTVVALAVATALAAGCAAPFQGRIANNLDEAGLPRPMAECMSHIWVERLNVLQLREISRLAADLRAEREREALTIGRLIARVRAVDDPVIFDVVSDSVARCALAR